MHACVVFITYVSFAAPQQRTADIPVDTVAQPIIYLFI
jgi:hypothetical protein